MDEQEKPGAESGAESSSISRRLEAMLESLPEKHQWEEMEQNVLRRIEEIPQRSETSVSSWLYWLFFASMLGVAAMGLLRILPVGGRVFAGSLFPAVGCSIMIVSALGLVWAALSGVHPQPEVESPRPAIRWLIVSAAWTAALVGTIVAVIPWASERAIPSWVIPFLILLAVSGLVGGLAQETRHQRDALALPSDAGLRRLALILGVLMASLGAVLQVWFVLFWIPD